MAKFLKYLLPILIISLVVAHFFYKIVETNNGTFVYPLDDTYIHMAIAKNIAFHSNWGPTRFEFGSAASSLLWPVILAVSYKLFGVRDLFPLLINYLIGLAFIVFVINIFRIKSVFQSSLLTVGLIFLTPFIPMLILGMEHLLYAFALILLIHEAIETGLKNERQNLFLIGLYSFIASTVRYENLIVLFVVTVYLFIRRKYAAGLTVLFFGSLPFLVFGWWSLRQGSFFIPSSVLLKSPSIAGLIINTVYGFLSSSWIVKIRFAIFLLLGYLMRANKKYLLILISLVALGYAGFPGIPVLLINCLILALLYFFGRGGKRNEYLIFMFALNAVYSLLISYLVIFTRLVYPYQFTRYESQILILTYITVFIAVKEFLYVSNLKIPVKRASALKTTVIIIVTLLFLKLFLSFQLFNLTNVITASRNIYDQQYQMAQFLRLFYNNQTIAVNDIGNVAYYTDIRLTDLWGLASIDVARAKINSEFSNFTVDELTERKGTDLAIVYDQWVPVPDSWVKVATWTIPNNYISAFPTVSFYVLNKRNYSLLKKNLIMFEKSRLPKEVRVIYY